MKESSNVGGEEMTLVELRYYFEQQLLHKYYFENEYAFIWDMFEAYREDTESDSNPLFDIISKLAEKRGIELPYSREQFHGEVIVLGEGELMIRLSLPEPEVPILCSDIYLVFSVDDMLTKRYFTVELLERKWLRKTYCLCERREDGFHSNHGIISNNIKKREDKMIQLYYGGIE